MPQQITFSKRGQALSFSPVKIHDGDDLCQCAGGRLKQPDTAGFDQPFDRIRRICDHLRLVPPQYRTIIRDQVCPHRHQGQGKGRFAAAGFANDQKGAAIKSDTTCMKGDFRRGTGHRSDRQANDKAGTQWIRRHISLGRADVFGPDYTAMCFDNLL